MNKLIKWLIIVVLGGIILTFILSLVIALKFTGDFKDLVEDLAVDFDSCASLGYPVLESYPRKCHIPDGETFTEDIGNEIEKMDTIRISNPRPNQKVDSPLIVEGKVKDNWFFEENFPIKLLDSEGKKLADGFATVKRDSSIDSKDKEIKEEFVDFQANLEFETPQTLKGWIILEKNNPSGLEENADQLEIPVKFDIETKPR